MDKAVEFRMINGKRVPIAARGPKTGRVAPPITLMTTADAARDMGLSANYIMKMCEGGEIEAMKKGRDWLITPHALASYKRRRERLKATRRRAVLQDALVAL